MNPSGTACLVGPDGHLRARIVDALLEAGWKVATNATMRERLDLGVFIPTNGISAPLSAMSSVDWWSCVGENLTSAFHCAKELIPRCRGPAARLCSASLLGEIGAPNQTAFSAAAAGIIGLVKALTVDVPTVRFSAVAPAFPVPEKLWSSADVDWHATSASLDATSIACATADAVLFLANDGRVTIVARSSASRPASPHSSAPNGNSRPRRGVRHVDLLVDVGTVITMDAAGKEVGPVEDGRPGPMSRLDWIGRGMCAPSGLSRGAQR